jgi:hypothetical protein
MDNNNQIKDEFKNLLAEAEDWLKEIQTSNKAKHPKKSHRDWENQIITLLRKLPNAKENVKKFVRLQRHYTYLLMEEFVNDEPRLMLLESSLSESIAFLKNLLENI